MDVLGKKGEEASEELLKVENRMKQLESHIDAVDSALSDFKSEIQMILEDEFQYQEQEISELKEALKTEEEIEELERRVEKLESVQEEQKEEIEDLTRSVSSVEEGVKDMVSTTRSSRSLIQKLSDRIKELDNRLNDVEGELVMETTNRDFDFEKKLDERDYKEDKKSFEEEFSKLRASINVLADELGKKDDIEVE
ncbi:MAG: hypothetical protein ABEJ83_03770 [Candidatus Nanohaloarchaea archaeon]